MLLVTSPWLAAQTAMSFRCQHKNRPHPAVSQKRMHLHLSRRTGHHQLWQTSTMELLQCIIR